MVLMQHSRTREDNERGGDDKRLQLNQISHLKWLVSSWPKCTTSPYPFTFLSIWTTGWCEGVISLLCEQSYDKIVIWNSLNSTVFSCPTYQEWWTSNWNVHHFQFWTNYSSVFFWGLNFHRLATRKRSTKWGCKKIQCNSYKGFFVKRIAPMLPDIEEFFFWNHHI
jgi:hypothetical protein